MVLKNYVYTRPTSQSKQHQAEYIIGKFKTLVNLLDQKLASTWKVHKLKNVYGPATTIQKKAKKETHPENRFGHTD